MKDADASGPTEIILVMIY